MPHPLYNACFLTLGFGMQKTFTEYTVWDKPVRWFHWINVLSIFSLIFVGLIMLYKTELGISGIEPKIALKELHVIIGYIFVINLTFRLVWAFIGSPSARFSSLFPGKGYVASVKTYISSIKSGNPQQFIAHNPLGKLAIAVIFLLLSVMAVSGLIRAGTDIYYPPFGSSFAAYVAAPGVSAATILPYDTKGTDEKKMASLKAFKSPVGKIHLYTAYLLMFIIILHVTAVILTETREGGGLISAMFSGKKVISEKPADSDKYHSSIDIV